MTGESRRKTTMCSAERARSFGRFELKLGIKDVLGEKVKFKQFNDVTLSNGQHRKVEEVTRAYNPGRNISLTFGVKL